MARNKTLEKILVDVRAEARLSPLPAHNVQTRDAHITLIQREQERLWDDFAWPHLRVQRFIPLQAGERFYDPDGALAEDGSTPTQIIPIDRIEKIEVKSDGRWLLLVPELPSGAYAVHDSGLDQRSSPAQRWKVAEGHNREEIEIWPVPDVNATEDDQEGYLRITGIRTLRDLVAESDRAELDDRLLALYVAGGLLLAAGAKDAGLKLEAANRHYGKLKGNLSKSPPFNMFGTTRRAPRSRPYIGTYRPPEV